MERSSSSCGRSPPESGFLAGALAAEGAAEGLADIVGHARLVDGRNRLHDRAAMLALLRLAQDQLRALGAFAQLLGLGGARRLRARRQHHGEEEVEREED